jgi:DNA-binding MarR family transcriptional regulator
VAENGGEQEPRWLDADEQQTWYALAYLLTRLPAALEAQMQRDAGFPHFDYIVLSGLSMAPERTLQLRVLAHYTGSTLSRLSNVVGRLEARGLVHRHPDPTDGRSTLATLTDQGWDTVVAAAPGHVAEVRRLVFDPLTRTQQRQLHTVAERILDAMNSPAPAVLGVADPDLPAD